MRFPIYLSRTNYPDEIAVSRWEDKRPRGVVIRDGNEFVAVRFYKGQADEQGRFQNLRHAIRWAASTRR